MFYTISNEKMIVTINDLGAEISSVFYKGKERVWQNENGSWKGKSPVLFPVCGNSSVIIDGIDCKMPFHGFARKGVFECVLKKNDKVSFLLKYDDETLAVYPFKFEFKITYLLKDNSIVIENEITNVGEKSMPFALGRHDSFAFDCPVGEYKLCFDEKEEFLSQKTDEKGRLINLYVDFGKGNELVVPEDYLTNGQTLIFGGIKNDRVTLKTLDDRPIAEFFFGEIRNLLFWRPEGARIICVEPWSALPDERGNCDISFIENEKYYILNKGETKTLFFSINYF